MIGGRSLFCFSAARHVVHQQQQQGCTFDNLLAVFTLAGEFGGGLGLLARPCRAQVWQLEKGTALMDVVG